MRHTLHEPEFTLSRLVHPSSAAVAVSSSGRLVHPDSGELCAGCQPAVQFHIHLQFHIQLVTATAWQLRLALYVLECHAMSLNMPVKQRSCITLKP
jgi:hypothetical protein